MTMTTLITVFCCNPEAALHVQLAEATMMAELERELELDKRCEERRRTRPLRVRKQFVPAEIVEDWDAYREESGSP
jgi:hypothetical protein